jgi:NAD-dependent deacetylase
MPSAIQAAAALLRASNYTVALSGAGVSTPSGIPDFRSDKAGLWSHVDPLEVASLWAYHERPDVFYRWIRPALRRAFLAQPNPAHKVLARMEAHGRLKAVLTQNIDSLHQRAGSQRVLELHGHTRTATCLRCRAQSTTEAFWADVLREGLPPPCAHCGGLLKPDVLLFGEPLAYDVLSAAQAETLACEVLLVVGTSLEVMPAADLPWLARRRGARLVVINRTPTPIDDIAAVVIRSDVVKVLNQLWRELDDAG